jgi:glycosyltransferase involved in cell wall biosynthesis
MSKHILFYDPELGGHHAEYVRHVAEYMQSHKVAERVTYVVHPAFPDQFQKITDRARRTSGLDVLPLRREEYETLHKHELGLYRSVANWRTLKRYALATDADDCLIAEMNLLQFALGLPSAHGVPFGIHGILFFPFHRIEPASNSTFSYLKSRLERLRKRLQMAWTLWNPKVQSIFLFNDPEGARWMNERMHRAVFSPLPDPIPEVSIDIEAEAAASDWSPFDDDGRMRFLLFGALRRQKGVFPLLEALQRLPGAVAQNASVLFLGSVEPADEDQLIEGVREIQRTQSDMKIRLENRFAADWELRYAIRESDVILVPYLRSEGSSGVLGHAANYSTPVIGSETGLIGHLIQKYQLGTSVPIRPEKLAGALERAIQENVPMSTAGAARYVRKHTADDFVHTLLSRISRSNMKQ